MGWHRIFSIGRMSEGGWKLGWENPSDTSHIVATSVVINIPRAICWGGIMFLTHSLVSPSVLFFERKLPLNYCTEFFWIIKFHYFSRNFGSFNLEYWHWVEVKMGWFLGGSYASLLNCFVCLMHTLPFITFLVVK